MTSQPRELLADLALAHKMADAADLITLSRFQSNDLIIETKPDTTPVTDADKATEKKIREFISKDRPEDLLEMLMSLGDSNAHWTALCSFVDRPIPSVSYPHGNPNGD